MSDTLKDPEPPEKGKALGAESTARICPACGKTYLGAFHQDCPSTGPTLKRSPATESSIDELPAEAKPFAQDPSRQLNQYLLVKQVGRGGMGAVWKAWDRNLTRWTAVKFLLAHEQHDILRFQREAKLAARLRHPNIAAIYEVGQAKSAQLGSDVTHYLAMEFIDGSSLAEAKLSQKEVLEVFLKVAQGIEAAHRGGVIHRDLKPQNIMLNAEGWPYVMDFGLAKALQGDSSLSVSGAIMGTPAYMPPEQAQGSLDEIDARSDVYSLGATLYSVLCRRPPFSGQTPLEVLNRVTQEDPPPPSSINKEIPPSLQAVVLRAMSKRREDRYASVADFARALQSVLQNEGVSAATPGAYDPTVIAPSSSRPKALSPKGPPFVLIAVVVVGVAVLGGVLFLSGRGAAPAPPVAAIPKPPPPKEPEIVKPEPPKEKPPEPVELPKPAAPRTEPKVEVPPTPPPPPPPVVPKIDEDELDWKRTQPLLAYETWTPGDDPLQAKANQLLSRYLPKEASREAVVARWFSGEIERARAAFRQGRRSAEQQVALSRRIAQWSGVLSASVQGIDALKDITQSAAALRSEVEVVTRGVFTLKILPVPFAQIGRMTCDGKALKFPKQETPIVLPKLDVGDYEIELVHPDLGKRTVKLSAAELKDGKIYVISGKMSDAALKVSESP